MMNGKLQETLLSELSGADVRDAAIVDGGGLAGVSAAKTRLEKQRQECVRGETFRFLKEIPPRRPVASIPPRRSRSARRMLLGTIAKLAFGYAGDTGGLEAWIGFSLGMGSWFCILKEIFMSEAGGVAGECSQAC